MLTDADLDYVRAEFVPLHGLCVAAGRDLNEVRAAIEARHLPAPPYLGLEYVPSNYFDLPDVNEFRRAYRGPDLEEVLNGYLNGTYFICVRDATVVNIARKNEVVDDIRAMLSEPRADDPDWRESLHRTVDELDELERPFSPDYDRVRFGRPTTRDELITEVRRRYPRDKAA